MAWNPEPEVADCREIARKWKKKQVIIIGIDDAGGFKLATYGETPSLCRCAAKLGDAAISGIMKLIESLS